MLETVLEEVNEEELVESILLLVDVIKLVLESDVEVLEEEPNGAQAEITNTRKIGRMDKNVFTFGEVVILGLLFFETHL
jgi:hypothetical protein